MRVQDAAATGKARELSYLLGLEPTDSQVTEWNDWNVWTELAWTELKDWLTDWLTDWRTANTYTCSWWLMWLTNWPSVVDTIDEGSSLWNEALATLSWDYKRWITHFKAGMYRVLNIRCYTPLSCHFEWQLYWHKWHTLRLALPLFYFVLFCRNKFG